MKNVKRILALLLICMIVVSIAACNKDTPDTGSANTGGGNASDNNTSNNNTGGGNTSDNNTTTGNNAGGGSTGGNNAGGGTPSSTKDTVTIGVTQDGGNLDPAESNALDIVRGVQLIYDTLWVFDSEGNWVWRLADSCDMTDPLRWVIKIKEGIKFSNGTDFTAEDVLFSLNKVNFREGQPGILLQFDMDNSKIIDDYTIEVAWTEYVFTAPAAVAELAMHDKDTAEADPQQTRLRPMGTGPYVMTEYVVNSHLTLERRDDYWGELPAIKTFNFIQLKEDSQRVNALQTGEVDIASVPAQDIEYLSGMPNLDVRVTTSARGSALYFNISQYSIFFENPDARKAVAYAIDRDAIAKLVYNNYATVSRTTCPVVALDIDDRFLDIGIYGDDYKVELAKELAASSGLAGKEIKIINNGTSVAVLTCELIQANLAAIGVTVNINSLDLGTWTTWLFDEASGFDMCIDGTHASNSSMSSFYHFAYRNMGGLSYISTDFEGKERVFDYMDYIRSIPEISERIEMNLDMTNIAIDEMLWLSLIDGFYSFAFADGLQGEVRDMTGQYIHWRNLYWT